MEDSRIDDLIAELHALRIQVARLETEVHRRENRTAPPTTPLAVAPPRTPDYAVGDRVRILNKIKKPATWNNNIVWSESDARLATVTEVRPTQIFFTTDNGVETWRAPNNLRNL